MESQRQAGPLPAGASRVYLSASDILANALLSLFQCTARKPQCLPPPRIPCGTFSQSSRLGIKGDTGSSKNQRWGLE